MSGLRRLASAVLALLFPLLTGCGGGGGVKPSGSSTGSFSLAFPSALSLQVPSAINQQNGAYPYAGTINLNLIRSSGYTGTVNLSVVASTLPAGVQAQFDAASLDAGSTTASLSIQAGYLSNPSLGTDTFPAQGDYSVTVRGTDASDATLTATTTLTLHLVAESSDFGLAFQTTSSATTHILESATATNNDIQPGVTKTKYILVYVAAGSYTTADTVALSVAPADVPSGWQVSLDATSTGLNTVRTLSILAPAGLTAGTRVIRISATVKGVTHVLPVVATYSPAPFYLQPAPQVTLQAGQSLTFPMYLWHNDDYFGTSTSYATADPAYVGHTYLTVDPASLPAGLSASFGNGDPTGSASAPLQLSAGIGTAPGTYTLQLKASRVGLNGTTTDSLCSLGVVVTGANSSRTLWFQNVEWGQTVLAPNLKLIAGKPALLRAQLLADQAGIPAPVLTAAIYDSTGAQVDTLTLSGPGTVPTIVAEGDLLGSGASGSSYTALVPAGDVAPGMSVQLQGLGVNSRTLNPAVDSGMTFPLTVVPIIVGGVAPVLPTDATLASEILAFWPFKAVDIGTHRAAYTTSTVIPQPGNATAMENGWGQLLSELAALRTLDGSSRDYYGFFNPNLQFPVSSTIVGLSYLGDGAGIGIDQGCAAQLLANGFANSDAPSGFDLATVVMVHELGHAFNLNHVPAGGAGSPQLDYPYFDGSIGTWGYDPAHQEVFDPAATDDIMSYSDTLHWVSDWDYTSALAFQEARAGVPGSLIPATSRLRGASEQWVVSGWIDPDGQPHLAPLVRATCLPSEPVAGSHTLVLTGASGSRSVSFSSAQVPDLPSGYRTFSFTVPAGEELTAAEVQVAGASASIVPGGAAGALHPARLVRGRSVAARARALAAAAQDGSLVLKESGGVLHLEWDASLHPYVDVFHQGDTRTTLGLHLTGGSADLPVDGLPAGGRFLVQYSDGLNPVVRSLGRP